MAKTKISEYSATANSNTDVASINIDEGCAPSGINNAIRAVMGHLKDFQQGTNGDPFNGPVNGTLGATTASTAVVTTLNSTDTTDASSTTVAAMKTAGGLGVAKKMFVGLDANIYGITVGRGAGAVSTNTAVGASALAANTSGASGVAIGNSALLNNTTASNNTAVGYQAGYTNSTGTANVFVGQVAGKLTTGSYNTFVGDTSGYNASTGTFNAFFGQGSGYLVTTGAKNTVIGSYSGNQGGLDIRTASNYIVLSDGDGNPRAYWNGASPTFNGGLTIASTGQVFAGGSSSGTSTQCYMYFSGTDSGAGSVRWYIGQNAFRSDGSYAIQNSGGTGLYLTNGGTSWTSTSDERLKTNLQPIENAAQKISTLRAVTGRFKTDDENVSRAFLIAQDVQAVLPQAVDASDPEKLGVQYTEVIPLLVAAIKELKAEFDAYKEAHP